MRVSPEIKVEAEAIYASLGMTLSEAINIFLHKSVMEGGLPFDARQPRYNKETEEAIAEARAILSGKTKGKKISLQELLDTAKK